jgi:hypothetical protein
MPDITNGFVTARENSLPLLLFSIIKVEVKTAGNGCDAAQDRTTNLAQKH